MPGDRYSRWLRLGEILSEEQLEALVRVGELLADDLADGSIDIGDVSDDVSLSVGKVLTSAPRESTTFKHGAADKPKRQGN